MIKFENTEVMGWEHAIRGMRNPMNSWENSDSLFTCDQAFCKDCVYDNRKVNDEYICGQKALYIGPNDLKLMKTLVKAGTDHRKFMRMIDVYVDITAPLYWWKEFDTYKVGTVANSCSTMHKIAEKEFELSDFSYEHLSQCSIYILDTVIKNLNQYRNIFVRIDEVHDNVREKWFKDYEVTCKKDIWWQMIQLLPSSYNQKRTVQMNYEVLANIYKSRKNHKLDEWSVGFMNWIETLPYSELITGEFGDAESSDGENTEVKPDHAK